MKLSKASATSNLIPSEKSKTITWPSALILLLGYDAWMHFSLIGAVWIDPYLLTFHAVHIHSEAGWRDILITCIHSCATTIWTNTQAIERIAYRVSEFSVNSPCNAMKSNWHCISCFFGYYFAMLLNSIHYHHLPILICFCFKARKSWNIPTQFSFLHHAINLLKIRSVISVSTCFSWKKISPTILSRKHNIASRFKAIHLNSITILWWYHGLKVVL